MERMLRRFDMNALYEALDAARRERDMTWSELLAQINRAFEGTSSIPISLSTVTGIAKRSSVTSAVILQVLRQMHRPPEDFLSGPDDSSVESLFLPEPGPGRVIRFDTRAIHAALDEERNKRGLTWKQVAHQLTGFTESTLRNLAKAPLIGFPRVMLLMQWLGRPAANFVIIANR